MTPLVQLCPVAAQQERKKRGLFQLGEQLEIIKKKKVCQCTLYSQRKR